jgi:SAM-dependent methyltransferase
VRRAELGTARVLRVMGDELDSALGGGVPSASDLRLVEESDLFGEMVRASDEWLERNAGLLAPYASKWVSDPLRQWSRRWEYPFVMHALAGCGARHVLDAGSGFTFFPYHLASRTAESVYCVDHDDLADLYARAGEHESNSVVFRRGDLRELPLADGAVDAAYSVSVLEHTTGFDRIVDELHRVLTPGGSLVVTFDVSLDGLSDIPVARAEQLLARLSNVFDPVDAPRDLDRVLARPGLLTTMYAASVDPSRLPWPHPRLTLLKSAWKQRRLPLARMKKLTCYGGIFRRA